MQVLSHKETPLVPEIFKFATESLVFQIGSAIGDIKLSYSIVSILIPYAFGLTTSGTSGRCGHISNKHLLEDLVEIWCLLEEIWWIYIHQKFFRHLYFLTKPV